MQPAWRLLTEALQGLELDLSALLLAWARVAPSVVLIPAFGLRAAPASVRVPLAVVLGASVAPALASAVEPSSPLPVAVVLELLRGLPVALAAAAALWTAEMVGGLADDLRGVREASALPVSEGTTPLGALLSLGVSLIFLESGGPTRVLAALTRDEPALSHAALRAVVHLTAGIELAVAVAAPIVVAAIVVEVATALFARALVPAPVQPVLAPLKSLVLLGALALLFERIVGLLALGVATSP